MPVPAAACCCSRRYSSRRGNTSPSSRQRLGPLASLVAGFQLFISGRLWVSTEVRRTWAPRGRTPVLRPRSCSWRWMSAIGALAHSRDGRRARVLLLFQPGAVRASAILRFLRHLRRHVRGRVVLLWDGVQPHRAAVVREWIARNQNWLTVERLPAYAPDLNPVEGMWSWLKGTGLANVCEDNLAPLYAAPAMRPHGYATKTPSSTAFSPRSVSLYDHVLLSSARLSSSRAEPAAAVGDGSGSMGPDLRASVILPPPTLQQPMIIASQEFDSGESKSAHRAGRAG